MDLSSTIGEILRMFLPAVLAAAGSIAVWKYQFSKEFETKKRAEWLEKQLSEFYGPIKILHREIRVLSELRGSEKAAFDEYANPENPTDDEKHAALIEKHNQEIRDDVIPTYLKIRDLFQTKVFLAEPDVVSGYDRFYLFLKGWQDHLERPIGLRFPSKAASELALQRGEPVEYFTLIEQQFAEKKTEYEKLSKNVARIKKSKLTVYIVAILIVFGFSAYLFIKNAHSDEWGVVVTQFGTGGYLYGIFDSKEQCVKGRRAYIDEYAAMIGDLTIKKGTTTLVFKGLPNGALGTVTFTCLPLNRIQGLPLATGHMEH